MFSLHFFKYLPVLKGRILFLPTLLLLTKENLNENTFSIFSPVPNVTVTEEEKRLLQLFTRSHYTRLGFPEGRYETSSFLFHFLCRNTLNSLLFLALCGRYTQEKTCQELSKLFFLLWLGWWSRPTVSVHQTLMTQS